MHLFDLFMLMTLIIIKVADSSVLPMENGFLPKISVAQQTPAYPSQTREQQFVLANLKEDTVLHVWLKSAGEGRTAELYARKIAAKNNNSSSDETADLSAAATSKSKSDEFIQIIGNNRKITTNGQEAATSKEPKTSKKEPPLSNEIILTRMISKLVQKQGKLENAQVVASCQEAFEHWFDFREVELQHKGEVRLSWFTADTYISYIYAFEPETVQEEGIRILYISPRATRLPADASYHFRAPLGWHSDPCGFTRTDDGTYHMFYQHYPHTQKWLDVHWGHAVSRDLVHWVHQPIFLWKKGHEHWCGGGYFSGSALPVDGGLRVFFTDHIDGRMPKEFQASVFTKDMYRPIGPPRVEIADLPEVPSVYVEEFADDFRDPIVFRGPGNTVLMTVGAKELKLGKEDRFRAGQRSKRDKNGLILLYKQNPEKATKNGSGGWEFQSIIWRDNRWKGQVAECAHLIPLGDQNAEDTLWVLMYSMQNSIDTEGRQNLSPIIVGNFDGKKFTPHFEQIVDFATGSFAYTGFYDPISRESVVIGWLANWPDFNYKVWPDLVMDAAYPTAMTLPRVLKLSPARDFLMIAPHPSVAKTRESTINSEDFAKFKAAKIPASGAVEIVFNLNYEQLQKADELKIVFSQQGKGEKGSVTVIISKQGLELVRGWRKASKYLRFRERTTLPITELRFFVDSGSLELFANGGRWTACARIPDEAHITHVQIFGPKTVLDPTSVQIWALKSTQPIQHPISAKSIQAAGQSVAKTLQTVLAKSLEDAIETAAAVTTNKQPLKPMVPAVVL